jgi:type IV secretion system protein VirD4
MSGPAKGLKRFAIIAGVVVTAGLIGLDIATQRQAASFHYPAEFGRGLSVGSVRLYAPWAFLPWMKAYAHLYRGEFFINLLIALGVLVVPTMIAVSATGPAIVHGAVRDYGEKAWATLADVRRAKLLPRSAKNSPRGRVFGKFGGKLLVYEGDEHAIVVGASRSGKGAGHVIPTLICWPHSVLAYDRKGELWHITADYRKRFSHVFRFEPTDPNTVRWNPLFEVRKGKMEIADIQNVVGILVDPLGLKAGDLSFWDQSASDFFTAVILHTLYAEPDERKNLAQVRRLLIDIDATLWAMKNTQHRHRPDFHASHGLARDADGAPIGEVHPAVLLGANTLESMDVRVRANVLATCRSALSLWTDPLVEYATSWSDFAIGDLVCSEAPVSFYITTPQAHADRLAFLVRIFMRQAINNLMEDIHHDSRGRRKKHRLLMMLDEFPKLGGLPFLENALGEMAGYGITAHLICQSFNDVFSKYGDRTSLFDNMHITATFATSEPNSIKKVIERAGKSTEMRESYSSPRTLFSRANPSVSLGEQQRYVLSEEDVRGQDESEQFLFVNNAKPIIANKIQYWEEAYFAERCGDFFHEKPAKFVQTPGRADLPPGKPPIDWIGVRAVTPASPMPAAPAEAAPSGASRNRPDDIPLAGQIRPMDASRFQGDGEGDADPDPENEDYIEA